MSSPTTPQEEQVARLVHTSACGLAALAMLAIPSRAQIPRADVQRFEWDPVIVHLGAERGRGVEVWVTTDSTHMILAWFDPEDLAAWIPSLDSLIAGKASAAVTASTPILRGRYDATMRMMHGVIQGQDAFGLRLGGKYFSKELVTWMPLGYAKDLRKGFAKSVDAAKKLGVETAADSAMRAYEMWEVDSLPSEPHDPDKAQYIPADLIPSYSNGGRVTLEFVVDAQGKIVPSSVVLLATPDGRLGRQWAGYVSAQPWIAGTIGGAPVATRIIVNYYLSGSGAVRINNPRVTP
jgi:hypothetical protein